MVGEVRRFSGSVSVGKQKTAKVTILAAPGEVVKLTVASGRVKSPNSDSWVELRITGDSCVERASGANPNVGWKGELFIDDANGIDFVAYNGDKYNTRTFYYAAQGVKIN